MKKWFFGSNKDKEENPEVNDLSEKSETSSPAESSDASDEINIAESVDDNADGKPAENEPVTEDDFQGNNDAFDSGNGVSENTAPPKKWILFKSKKPWSIKKKIIVSSICIVLALILGAGIYMGSFILNPSINGFKSIKDQIPANSDIADVDDTDTTADPDPTVSVAPQATATVDEVGEFINKGDFSILENTVNILLIGVDYAPERKGWHGKHTYHSDVMIVLSVNRQTNQVSLISLPRDTYAHIPGVDGIYKLNASLNCGGKWPNPKACQKVCQAASWMIGGLPVDYFYAVDMQAVKDLVDKIGGVDYNVDIAFTQNHRKYKKGMQHMDGQAVLDYMRIRKEAYIKGSNADDEQGDWNRVNRQKNMLKAIFKKLKDSGGILQIPNVISSISKDDLVTNVPTEYTYALAGYSLSIDPEDIKLYSMSGPTKTGIFGLNYVITTQSKRVDIIKKVFGIDITNKSQVKAAGIKVPDYSAYDWSSADGLWIKMQRYVTHNQADKVLNKVKSKLDADAKNPDKPANPPADDKTVYRKYPSTGKEWTLYNQCLAAYDHLDSDKVILAFQKSIKKLAGYFKIKLATDYWEVIYNPYFGKSNQPYVHNDIKVDPR